MIAAALENKIDLYKLRKGRIEDEIRETTEGMRKSIYQMEQEIEDAINRSLSPKILAQMGRPFVIKDLEEWDCHESPFGRCFIDYQTDYEPCCIFCGEPEDRQ